VPKKEGMIVVKNTSNELTPTKTITRCSIVFTIGS